MVNEREMEYRSLNLRGYKFWDGPRQHTTYEIRASKSDVITSCATKTLPSGWIAPNVQLAIPNNLNKAIPSMSKMAKDLDLGTIEVCLDFRILPKQTQCKKTSLCW